MESNSNLSKASFTNHTADFVPKFDIENFLEAFKIFKVQDVEELFIRIHVPIKRLELADIVHLAIPLKQTQLVLKSARNGYPTGYLLGTCLDFFLFLLHLFLDLFLPLLHFLLSLLNFFLYLILPFLHFSLDLVLPVFHFFLKVVIGLLNSFLDLILPVLHLLTHAVDLPANLVLCPILRLLNIIFLKVDRFVDLVSVVCECV